MTRQKHSNQSLLSLIALGKSVLSNLLAAARPPIATIFGRAKSPLYQPSPDQPMDPPSAAAVVTQPQVRNAKIIPFPTPNPAVDKPGSPAAPRSLSITNILSYTGPFSSSASRAAIPRLLLGSLR